MRSFFDSNVLAYTDDAGDSVKQARAVDGLEIANPFAS